jgi:hypothetical protein
MSRASRIVVTLLAGAVIGLTVFAALVWRAVTIEQADTSEAAQRFAAIRASLGAATPLLDIDDAGRVTRRAPVPVRAPQAIDRLTALAYQEADHRLVRAEVPFWFFKLKGPAARLALGGTGFDLDPPRDHPRRSRTVWPCRDPGSQALERRSAARVDGVRSSANRRRSHSRGLCTCPGPLLRRFGENECQALLIGGQPRFAMVRPELPDLGALDVGFGGGLAVACRRPPGVTTGPTSSLVWRSTSSAQRCRLAHASSRSLTLRSKRSAEPNPRPVGSRRITSSQRTRRVRMPSSSGESRNAVWKLACATPRRRQIFTDRRDPGISYRARGVH